MKSRTSWFNIGVAKNYLRRCWPLWTSWFALLIWLFPVGMADKLSRVNIYSNNFDRHVLNMSVSTGYLSIAVSVLAVMLMYSWLYSAKGSGMMCSLPVRRETLFVTCFVTGLAPLLLADIIAVMLAAALTAGSGYFTLGAYMQGLAALLLLNFAFYCFAVFCAVLTGNIIILPAVFLVLNFAVALAESSVRALLSKFVYGMISGGGVLDIFSPLYFVLGNIDVAVVSTESSGNMLAMLRDDVAAYCINGFIPMVIYCVAGLALAAAAMLILKRRHMESASDTVAVPILKPVFKYCMTFGVSLVLAIVVYETFSDRSFIGLQAAAVVLALMLLGAFIGYFAAEMLLQKTVQVFKNAKWKGLIISFCICAVFVALFEADVFGYERYIPKASEIEYVELWQGDAVLKEPENIEEVLSIHRQVIDNKPRYENREVAEYINLSYRLKNGGYVTRRYIVPDSTKNDPAGELMRLQALSNSREAIDQRCTMELPVTEQTVMGFNVNCWVYDENGNYNEEHIALTAAQAVDFYENYLLPDIEAGTMGRYWWLYNDQRANILANVRFSLDLSNRSLIPDPEDYNQRIDEYYQFNLNMDAVNCLRWLEENTDFTPVNVGRLEVQEKWAKDMPATQAIG